VCWPNLRINLSPELGAVKQKLRTQEKGAEEKGAALAYLLINRNLIELITFLLPVYFQANAWFSSKSEFMLVACHNLTLPYGWKYTNDA
jgi:hypothetical protein